MSALTVDQGAALLWLRKAGGIAGCNRDGAVSIGGDRCPLVFTAFDGLERAGLVQMRLPGDVAQCRLELLTTEAGVSFPIEPESERRLDALLRRFDD